ncbi:hypothetical protein GGI07_001706 [Coemansia sp. Benny D115]|nr:hypothetical protein GGI07_001706 [Coemansia sp. Benny D115]
MGVLSAGTGLLRTAALGAIWPLAIVNMILSILVAANGHWKPRAVSIYTAIISALTIVTLPFIFLGKFLRLGRFGSARCSRMWELFLTALWLSSWVWMATQLNKFHCTNPTTRVIGQSTSTPSVINQIPTVGTPVTNFGIPSANLVAPGTNVGFSLHGHAITPEGGSMGEARSAEEKDMPHARVLGYNGRRRYAKRCRVFKAMFGFTIPIFAILALDVMAHMWRSGERHRDLSRTSSLSPSVSSVSSVGSPRLASAAHPGAPAADVHPAAVETKV